MIPPSFKRMVPNDNRLCANRAISVIWILRTGETACPAVAEPPVHYQLLPFIGANAIDFTH